MLTLAEPVNPDSIDNTDKSLNAFGYGGSEEKKDFNDKVYDDKTVQDLPQDHGFNMFAKSGDPANDFKCTPLPNVNSV